MSKLSLRPIPIREVFRWFDQRRFAVPEIQREFVWNAKRACALLDSIYKGYPVGTAMIWQTGREKQSQLRHSRHLLPPFDTANRQVLFLLDGQQRLSVLYSVRRGEERENASGRKIRFGDICFSASEEWDRFVYLRRPDPEIHFRVADILSERWRSHFRNVRPRVRSQIKRCRQRLLEYELPFVFTRSRELREVREAFIRINTQGMRISEADRAFSTASAVRPLHRFRNLQHGLAHGFNVLAKEVYWNTLALVKGYNSFGQTALVRLTKELDQSEDAKQWFEEQEPKVAEAIRYATDYLAGPLGVTDYSLLPSVNMVSLLALFFHSNGSRQPTRRQKQHLARWFWHTAVLNRYTGSRFRGAIKTDAEFMRALAHRPRQAQYRITERAQPHILRTQEYQVSSSLTRAFILLLRRQRPCYVTNGEPIHLGDVSSRRNNRDRHHIWPKKLLEEAGLAASRINSLCNICLLVAHDNRRIGRKRPAEYLEEFHRKRYFGRTMRSHLVPSGEDSPLWQPRTAKAFGEFLEQRRKLLEKAFNEAAGAKLFDSR